MTIKDLLELYDDLDGIIIISTDTNKIVANNKTFIIAENKFLCAEEILCFNIKDGTLHIKIHEENELSVCDKCNKPCCYGCSHAE